MTRGEQKSKLAPTVVAVIAVAMLPVLYVLSIGPAAGLAERGIISDEPGSPAVVFYFPLIWLCETVPLAGDVLSFYMHLFGVK